MNKLKSALELIFSREQKSYENDISLLTAIQLKCLMAIAIEGGKKVFSVSFMKSAGFNNPHALENLVSHNRQITKYEIFIRPLAYPFDC